MSGGLRVLGIPIAVDLSWALVGLLVGGAFHLAALGAGEGAAVSAAIAAGGTLLLAAGVLGHELSHAVVARLRGIPAVQVTLFAFGGYSQLETEPERPADELIVAAAGPLASLAFAGALYGVRVLLPGEWAGAGDVLVMLVLVNLGVAAFNLLPGLPLDGGRVLRAVLRRRHPADTATVVAARTGRILAILLVLGGVAGAAAGWPTALWSVPVGVFLYRLAVQAEREVAPDTLVSEIMQPVGEPVGSGDVVRSALYLPVVSDGLVVGVVPPSSGPGAAGELMIPLRRSDLVDGMSPASQLGSRLRRRRRPAVVVVGRRMVGVVPPKARPGAPKAGSQG